MSTERGEDDAWRSIVDNYGERPTLDDEPGGQARDEEARAPVADPAPSPAGVWDDEPEERFVPPLPPRAPRLPLPQRLAWLAVLGSPGLLVVALLVSYDLPELVGYALVAGFVGGFGYLVWTMQRAEQRDPWDDGAQI